MKNVKVELPLVPLNYDDFAKLCEKYGINPEKIHGYAIELKVERKAEKRLKFRR